MASISQEIKIVSRKGEVLSIATIQELKDAVKCKVMLKGEADEELYRAAIDRYNKAWVAEAVSVESPYPCSLFSILLQMLRCVIRALLFSARPKQISLPVLHTCKSMILT
jgi:hypothetical protein